MSSSKNVLTATTVLGIFGTGWLIAPDAMGRFWRIAPGANLDYMGTRYGALLIGLAVTVWLAREEPDSRTRRAVTIGALVSMAVTTVLSLYGAVALGLNAWSPFAVELALTVGLAWASFVRPKAPALADAD